MPGIEDPRFERAVIFLCVHDAEHAMGLTVNRPVEGLTIAKLLAKLGVKSSARSLDDLVLMGGPVEPERGFVLHTDDYACEPSSLAIGGGVALTATREVLEAMAGSDGCPRRSAMALGYAGWNPGQLEREIRDNVWLTCEADEGLLFDDEQMVRDYLLRHGDHPEAMRLLAKIGIAAENLSAQAGRA